MVVQQTAWSDAFPAVASRKGLEVVIVDSLAGVLGAAAQGGFRTLVAEVEMIAGFHHGILDALQRGASPSAILIGSSFESIDPRYLRLPRMLWLTSPPSAEVLLNAIEEFAIDPLDRAVDEFADQFRLSPSERAVVNLSTRGIHSKAVADQLRCAPATIDSHWKRVLRKSQTSDRQTVISQLLNTAASGRMYRTAARDSVLSRR
jgi:DNA-binding NarL/FixJ family response regulator